MELWNFGQDNIYLYIYIYTLSFAYNLNLHKTIVHRENNWFNIKNMSPHALVYLYTNWKKHNYKIRTQT